MQTWEYSMTSAMRVAMKQNKFNILNLYIKLEKASKKYLESGEMKNGDVFFIPLEDGAFLEQKFYDKYSTLSLINPDKTAIMVISEQDSITQEYRYLLGYSQALKNSGLGIGARYPEKLPQILKEIKIGQVLVFDNGRSFVCEKNENGFLQLVRTSDTTNIPHISAFKDSERISVLLYDNISLQHFYAQVRDDYNDDVRFRITTTYKAQEILNQCLAGLDKNTKLLKIGPNEIRVKRNFLSKELSFYNKNGTKVPEESIKLMLGWLDAAPVITEFKRKNHTAETEFNDNMIRSDFDTLFSLEGYEEAYTLIAGYCKQNEKDLSINFNSYIDGEAVSFIFKYENDVCHIYKANFANNNYNSEPTSIKEVSDKEFIAFCEVKYNETFIRVHNDIKNEILQTYPQYHGEFLDKVINNLTEKKIKEEKLFSPEITPIREDLSTLIESLEEQYEYEQE